LELFQFAYRKVYEAVSGLLSNFALHAFQFQETSGGTKGKEERKMVADIYVPKYPNLTKFL